MLKKVYRSGLNIGKAHARRHWERYGLYGTVGLVFSTIVALQFAYPWQNLPLYTVVDGQSVGGQSMDKVIKSFDDKYAKLPIALYFGDSPKAYRQPLPDDIGLNISSRPQIHAKAYAWWLRIIPTSLWWAHMVTPTAAPSYARNNQTVKNYVQKELGQSCSVTPQNASLEYRNKKLSVVSAIDGGTCELKDVEQILATVTPNLTQHSMRVAMKSQPAKIRDDAAAAYAKQLSERTQRLTIKAGTSSVSIPQDSFFSWLDFAAPDTGITATVNADRAADFLDKQLAPKVSVNPGTSNITTLDFAVVSRVEGAQGRAIDTTATIDVFNRWIDNQEIELVVQVRPLPAAPRYNRTYTASDTGISALITQFAQSHAGTFGVSFVELDGQRRRAGYQETRLFQTASTYKLFVAYSTLKRIESGQWHWSDQISGGRDLTRCFDDMIVKSDNACAEVLLSKIGYRTITNEIQALGLKNSSFMKHFIQTTAADLTTFVGSLYSGQLLSPTSTSTLLSAMKRNIYRQGIPAGAKGAVADKVGFLFGLLHDAAIVYSPSGTYVLTIMTDGSSWGTIAELARQIEALHSQ